MDIEAVREYCLGKKAVTESFPFNETVLVFKVMDKMFLLTDLDDPTTINLKCDPDYALELREDYEDITAGYHMNKKYWNTVQIDGMLGAKMIKSLIDHSYEEVLNKLPARVKREYEAL